MSSFENAWNNKIIEKSNRHFFDYSPVQQVQPIQPTQQINKPIIHKNEIFEGNPNSIMGGDAETTTKTKKKRFIIPNDKNEIINMIIKDKPTPNNTRKALKKYIEILSDDQSLNLL